LFNNGRLYTSLFDTIKEEKKYRNFDKDTISKKMLKTENGLQLIPKPLYYAEFKYKLTHVPGLNDKQRTVLNNFLHGSRSRGGGVWDFSRKQPNVSGYIFYIFHNNERLGKGAPHIYYPTMPGKIWVRYTRIIDDRDMLVSSKCISCGISGSNLMCEENNKNAVFCNEKCQEKYYK
jgi:hypothetical protein